MRAAVVRLAFASMIGPLAACPPSPGLLPLREEIGAPAQPTAAPGDGHVVLAWSPFEGATTFNVYYSETPSVTKADAKVMAATSPTVIPGLTNGAVYYFALSAVTAAGEGPLSSVACAMPTVSNNAGLTLYDPLCGPRLDGGRWGRPGASSVGVSGGAAVLAVDVENQAPTSDDALHYWAGAAVRTVPGQRVTTLVSDMRVPAGSASATGGVKARGLLRFRYQPPASASGRPQQDALKFEAGLIQTPTGLMAFRTIAYCAGAGPCTTLSAAGIDFVDPPEFARIDETTAGAPAAYDTTYSVTIELDEAAGVAGVLHWKIAGGAFGAGVSGSADPTEYLESAPAWSGVSLAEGYRVCQIWAETFDTSETGGGSGKVTVRFDNVKVGFDGGPAAQYDDFSGTGENSGPIDLSANKWAAPGSRSAMPSGGSLAFNVAVTSAGSYAGSIHEIALRNPSSVSALQADISIPAFSPGMEGDVQAAVEGAFYNDGTPDETPDSRLGDIRAKVVLDPRNELATWSIDRCTDATCTGLGFITGGQFAGVPGGTSLHAVLVRWDPAVQRFTFAVDGNVIEVDPTAQAPVVAAPKEQMKRIRASTFTWSSPAGTRASIDVKVNNVFVAP